MLTDPYGTSPITKRIIGCAIKVHDVLGPGLFESIYNECLQYEFKQERLSFQSNIAAPVVYKGVRLKSKFYLDLVVEETVPVELKSISMLAAIHKKQLLSQLWLTNLPVGLLINFNVETLSQGGINRVVNAKYRPVQIRE
ncbi:MAG TPA: GxxExxY protein [Vicinamibacterales bacterium]|nr:GxxExxY protein [Vicinamibacterales bacterium]